MSYRYRCGSCRTTSMAMPSRTAAEAVRLRHCYAVHGGMHPDVELIERHRERFAWRSFWRAVGVFVALPVTDFLWRHM